MAPFSRCAFLSHMQWILGEIPIPAQGSAPLLALSQAMLTGLNPSAFGVQIASPGGRLLLLRSVVCVICRRVDMKAPVLNLLTRGSLLMLVSWSLTALWIAVVVFPVRFGGFFDSFITPFYALCSFWFLSLTIPPLVVQSFFKTAR